jgi:5-carboxymethyl-2-hydroxymuconate isomerase
MPHLIIEHSSDIKKSHIKSLQVEVQNIMASITEGNFDPDQCKCRSLSFDEYLVGKPDQESSSFLHITIKILAGRTLEVRKKLAEKTLLMAKNFFADEISSPNEKDQIVAIGSDVADLVTGIPHVHLPTQNSNLTGKRCDISVDIL